MSSGFAIQTTIEAVIAILLIIGLINEDKVAAWEQRIFFAIKRRIRGIKRNRCSRKIINMRDGNRQTGA